VFEKVRPLLLPRISTDAPHLCAGCLHAINVGTHDMNVVFIYNSALAASSHLSPGIGSTCDSATSTMKPTVTNAQIRSWSRWGGGVAGEGKNHKRRNVLHIQASQCWLLGETPMTFLLQSGLDVDTFVRRADDDTIPSQTRAKHSLAEILQRRAILQISCAVKARERQGENWLVGST